MTLESSFLVASGDARITGSPRRQLPEFVEDPPLDMSHATSSADLRPRLEGFLDEVSTLVLLGSLVRAATGWAAVAFDAPSPVHRNIGQRAIA